MQHADEPWLGAGSQGGHSLLGWLDTLHSSDYPGSRPPGNVQSRLVWANAIGYRPHTLGAPTAL